MLVWGGNNNIYLNDGSRFDPATGIWTPITTNGAPVARSAQSAVWTGSEMLIWGGYNNGNFNDTWSYTPGKVMYLYQKP
jgi:N-acetylneuraminic acid mutarotase